MRKGYTLIELVIVMSILLILIAVGATSYTASIRRSHDAARKADIKLIQAALEQYRNKNGSYPERGWVNSTQAQPWITELTPEYIKELPKDPKNTIAVPGGGPDQVGNYIYGYYSADGLCGLNGGEYYMLGTKLEHLQDTDVGPTRLTATCNWPAPGPDPNNPYNSVYVVSNP